MGSERGPGPPRRDSGVPPGSKNNCLEYPEDKKHQTYGTVDTGLIQKQSNPNAKDCKEPFLNLKVQADPLSFPNEQKTSRCGGVASAFSIVSGFMCEALPPTLKG